MTMTDDSKAFNIAILGVTGLVGEAMLSILEERGFPVNNFYPLASRRSAGKPVSFNDSTFDVIDAETFDFSLADIALFSAGSDVSAEYAPKAAEAGCIVIDNTSCFRYDPEIPLIVPEVNAEAIADYRNRRIIANPNCSTIQMVVALKPIYDAVGIERINVATYQAVSGSGRAGLTELETQTLNLINGKALEPDYYPVQMAFNLIPQIDNFQDNGYTREEMKMVWETRRLLGDDTIQVNPTAVRVPVFYGHSEAIHIETKEKLTAVQARQLLQGAPGVILSEEGIYPTPAKDAMTEDAVYVGRLREDISHPRGLNLWVVSDNIRKGAALNAVQIAEILIESCM